MTNEQRNTQIDKLIALTNDGLSGLKTTRKEFDQPQLEMLEGLVGLAYVSADTQADKRLYGSTLAVIRHNLYNEYNATPNDTFCDDDIRLQLGIEG